MTMPRVNSSVIVRLLEPVARVGVRDGHEEEEDRGEDEDEIRHDKPPSANAQLKLKPTSVRKKWLPFDTPVFPIEYPA